MAYDQTSDEVRRYACQHVYWAEPRQTVQVDACQIEGKRRWTRARRDDVRWDFDAQAFRPCEPRR